MFTDTTIAQEQDLPFIWAPQYCDRCFGIGLHNAPQGGIRECPAITLGQPHPELSDQGKRIVRAVELLRRRDLEPDIIHFDIARTIAQYSTDRPCSARELTDRHFSYIDGVENRRRKVTETIRFLRDIWCLPVASSKAKPAGYWISVDLEDFKAYVKRATAEPITTLSTLHRMARANYPEFAEQLELDFWRDMSVEEQRAA
jgi:hypothetical protein